MPCQIRIYKSQQEAEISLMLSIESTPIAPVVPLIVVLNITFFPLLYIIILSSFVFLLLYLPPQPPQQLK